MRIIALVGMLWAALPVMAAERFSDRLTAEERQAAGLGQLTPEQLAALDALVRRDQEGGEKRWREQLRADVVSEVTEKARDEARAEEQQRKLAGTRVLSRISGRYDGWDRGTEFRLENGQVWRHTGSAVHYVKAVDSPAVLIEKIYGGWRLFDAGGGWCPVIRVR